MLDIKFIRENPQIVKKAAENKGYPVDIDHVLEIDKKHRELSSAVQQLREERNRLSKAASNAVDNKNIEEGKKLKEKLEREEHALKAVEEELNEWLLKIPNIPKKDVKIGKDESENEIIRKHGTPTKFSAKGGPASGGDFPAKDHLELGELLDIIDVKRAAKVSGTRFGYLKREAVLLEFALVQLAFEVLVKEGFIPIVPPVLVNQ
ncbi:serine--tRNA ligase, partial [Candidatus Microgenomates bacterium]|nr:serine--tRNA ligase [Candidatus Microgenomates bacterium]